MNSRSETIGEIASALATAQSELRPAVKDAVNPHLKSKYANLASVWEAAREPLVKNGLSVVQTFWPAEPNTVTVVTTLMHKSGEWIESPLTLPVGKNDAQGYGSAITYARRYGLSALLGVIADEDDDGHGAGQKQTRVQAPPRSAPVDPAAPVKSNGTSAAGYDTKALKNGIASYRGFMINRKLDPESKELSLYLLNRASGPADEFWTSRKQLTENDWTRCIRVLGSLKPADLNQWVNDYQATIVAEEAGAQEPDPSDPFADEPCIACGDTGPIGSCGCSLQAIDEARANQQGAEQSGSLGLDVETTATAGRGHGDS